LTTAAGDKESVDSDKDGQTLSVCVVCVDFITGCICVTLAWTLHRFRSRLECNHHLSLMHTSHIHTQDGQTSQSALLSSCDLILFSSSDYVIAELALVARPPRLFLYRRQQVKHFPYPVKYLNM